MGEENGENMRARGIKGGHDQDKQIKGITDFTSLNFDGLSASNINIKCGHIL